MIVGLSGIHDFMHLSEEQEAEILTRAYFSIEDPEDRYNALRALLEAAEESEAD